jgi:hypothetical protein
MRTLLCVLPAASLLALAGCTGYSPPPRAVLSCEQTDPTGGNFEYLNCLRDQTQIPRPAGQASQQPSTPARPAPG